MSKIIMIILMFALIVLIHELGHFLAARFFKVKVNEFAIGMGPKLFSKQKGETLYSIRALPLGGFCSIEGEAGDSYEENSMMAKKPWQKFIIFVAGAVMNFLLAWLIFTIIIGYRGYSTNEVDLVQENLPAYTMGIKKGDRIIAVDGNKTDDLEDILSVVKDPNKSYEFTIIRENNKEEKIVMKPQIIEDGTAKFGFATARSRANIGRMIVDGFKTNFLVVKQVLQSFVDLVTGKVGADQLAGIVGVVQVTSDVWNEGMKVGFMAALMNLLYIAGVLSANLCVFNLLPLPALDGGRIVFTFIEMVRRKPINPEKEGMVHFVGFVLLMVLMVFVLYNDIMRIFT